MLYRILLLFTSCILFVPSGAQNPLTTYTRQARVRYTRTPITVNGILSEWTDRDSIFFQDWHKRGDDDNRASVKIAWDKQKLYLAYRVWDTKLNARFTESNRDIFTDDCVELYIGTNYQNALEDKLTTQEHQFVINVNNALSTVRGKAKPMKGDPGKDFNWKMDVFSVVKTNGTLNNNTDIDSGYVVEAAINWASIGYIPKAKDTLLFDLCVEDRDQDSIVYYAFDISFLPQYFSQPKRWWKLILEDNSIAPPSAKASQSPVQPKRENRSYFIFLALTGMLILGSVYYLLKRKKRDANKYQESIPEEAVKLPQSPHYDDLVKKAIHIIEEEYKKELKTGEVADRLHISERHLQRILKESTGKRFRQYLNEIRIKKSMELLKDERIHLNEIAFEVGYQSYSHFIKIFKLYNQGISPNNLREQNRQNTVLKTT